MFKSISQKSSHALILAFAFILTFGGYSHAGEVAPFDQKKFEEAQAGGKTILVHVYADWCPTCRKQAPEVARLSNDPAFSKAVVFRLRFDDDKQALKMFRVQHQSTLIAFKGKTETGRSTGETDPQKIRALIEKAL